MTKKKSSSTTKRGIDFKKLTDYRSANIAPLILGLFYIIFPWFNTGVLDQTTAIFGIVFLTVAVMRAREANYVLSGLFQGFIGLSYLFAVAGLVDAALLWILTLAMTALFFVFELEIFHFGPKTKKADAFQIVPMLIMAFALITAFAGYGNIFIIDFSNFMEMFNYGAMMVFSLVYAFQLAGWNVTKNQKTTNQLILVLGLAVIATALLGVYQGTLFQWS